MLRRLLLAAILGLFMAPAFSQMPDDAIMLGKKQLCTGFTYMHSQWNEYWEGTLKRDNANIGTVSTQSVAFMGAYGITDHLMAMVGVPYVWTHASAGTLHGLKGFQDGSVDLKWEFLHKKFKKNILSLFVDGGFSTPLTNYEPDFQPMSIGLGSTNLSGRLTVDYQRGIFFATLSGAYVWRSNVTIDRTSYYTTEQHNTNEVQMPDVFNSNLNIGIREKFLIAEVVVRNMSTLGGFDIRRNDMPFPSNNMDATSVGAHAKYYLPFARNLEVIGGGDFVVHGRNVGQSLSFDAGLYYIFSL